MDITTDDLSNSHDYLFSVGFEKVQGLIVTINELLEPLHAIYMQQLASHISSYRNIVARKIYIHMRGFSEFRLDTSGL